MARRLRPANYRGSTGGGTSSTTYNGLRTNASSAGSDTSNGNSRNIAGAGRTPNGNHQQVFGSERAMDLNFFEQYSNRSAPSRTNEANRGRGRNANGARGNRNARGSHGGAPMVRTHSCS